MPRSGGVQAPGALAAAISESELSRRGAVALGTSATPSRRASWGSPLCSAARDRRLRGIASVGVDQDEGAGVL